MDRRFRAAVASAAPPDDLVKEEDFRRALEISDDEALEEEYEELDDFFVVQAMEFDQLHDGHGEEEKGETDEEDDLEQPPSSRDSDGMIEHMESEGDEGDEDVDEMDEDALFRRLLQQEYRDEMIGGFTDDEEMDGDGMELLTKEQLLARGLDDLQLKDSHDDDVFMAEKQKKEEEGEEETGETEASAGEKEEGEQEEKEKESGGEDTAGLPLDLQLDEAELRRAKWEKLEKLRPQDFGAADFGLSSAEWNRLSQAERELLQEERVENIRAEQRTAERRRREQEKHRREYERSLEVTKALLRKELEANPDDFFHQPLGEEEEEERMDGQPESGGGGGFLGLQQDPERETRRQQRARERARRERLRARDEALHAEIDAHLARMFPKKTPAGFHDAESILSTYSNLYNHPRTLSTQGVLSLKTLKREQRRIRQRQTLRSAGIPTTDAAGGGRDRDGQTKTKKQKQKQGRKSAREIALAAERRLEQDWEHYEAEDFTRSGEYRGGDGDGRGGGDGAGEEAKRREKRKISPRVAGEDHWKETLRPAAVPSAAVETGEKEGGGRDGGDAVIRPIELSRKGMPLGVLQRHSEERRRVQEARRREETLRRLQEHRMMSGKYIPHEGEHVGTDGRTIVVDFFSAWPMIHQS